MPLTDKNLRALLALGRVSNLPTVWSNCLAAWLLSGGGSWWRFAVLCVGASFLYLGGMFLNDTFDVQFDQQRRKERPIPSGAIPERTVWRWGWGWLVAGVVCLACLGKVTAVLALLLAVTIVFYDVVHKLLAFAPVFMAQCRFLLYLVAASCASSGMAGLAIWSGLALGAYVLGVSYLAQKESTRAIPSWWPVLGLAVPVMLAWLVNPGASRSSALFLSGLLALWSVRSLRNIWWSEQPHTGRAVAGLLAGIVLVDWLAIADQGREFGFVFIGLFLLALALQRFVPAT